MLAAVSTSWPKRAATATPASHTIAAMSNVEIVVEDCDGLPAVGVDRQRFGHALNNLLDNALTYTEAGGRITLSAAPGQLFDPSNSEGTLNEAGDGENVNAGVGVSAGGRMTPTGISRMLALDTLPNVCVFVPIGDARI